MWRWSLFSVVMFGAIVATEMPADDDDSSRTEAAIRELVRRGAVVKRFEVRETETAGLLVRLKTVHLDGDGKIAPDIVAALSLLPELSVELRGLPIRDEGLKSLLSKTSLIGLDVSGSEISDRGLKPLETTRSRLRMLDLSFTRVGDEGLRSLPALSELRHLSLIGSRVTNHGIDSLAKLRSLRELYLARTSVSSDAMDQLRRQLPKCRVER